MRDDAGGHPGAAPATATPVAPAGGDGGRLRILLVNQYYDPDTAATAQRLTQLGEDLARYHDVTVLAGHPSYSPSRPTPRRWWGRVPAHTVSVIRVPSTAFGRYRLPLRLVNYVTYLAAAAVYGLGAGPVDVVLVATDPPLVGVVGWWLAWVHRVPFVYQIADLHPDAAVSMGMLRSPWIVRLARGLNGLLFRRARRLVVLSESMKRRVIEQGAPADRVEVIANWEDTEQVRPEPKDNPWSRGHGLADRYVVMYAGNLGMSQDLELCIQLAAALRDLPDAVVVLIGDGAAKTRLERLAADLGLENVRFFPFEPADRMRYSLAAADLFVLPLSAGLDGLIVPSKLFTIMAAGRPFVAAIDAGSEVARVVDCFGCGARIEPGDLAGLERAARWFHAHREAGHAMGARGREVAESRYSREAAATRYRRVLEAAASGSGRGRR